MTWWDWAGIAGILLVAVALVLAYLDCKEMASWSQHR